MSIEGSQIIGNFCKKNIVELNDSIFDDYISGKDIYDFDNIEFRRVVILKYLNDFLGSSVINKKILKNNLPKERRVSSIIDRGNKDCSFCQDSDFPDENVVDY